MGCFLWGVVVMWFAGVVGGGGECVCRIEYQDSCNNDVMMLGICGVS